MLYRSPGRETLCQIAARNALLNCSVLRSHNSGVAQREELVAGDEFTVVDMREALRDAPTETRTSFLRRSVPPPAIRFIRDTGKGDGLAPDGTLTLEPDPRGDPTLDTLAVTNYVSTRGGDGTVPNNFPADTVSTYDPLGSRDPDHFKIEVCDPTAARRGAGTVQVLLLAMRPEYERGPLGPNGRPTVVPVAGEQRRPPGGLRQLTVTCRRIGTTSYYRSAYLRLVNSRGQVNGRPTQCLVVAGFFGEADAAVYEKHYSQPLHQVIMAEYTPAMCQGSPRCKLRCRATMEHSRSLHVSVWTLDTTPGLNFPTDVEVCINAWLRRTMSLANVRVILENNQRVPEPYNMLVVGNRSSATRGRAASGRTASGAQSVMSFDVDGVVVRVPLHRGDMPIETANRIKRAIETNDQLLGFTARIVPVPTRTGASLASGRGQPCDVLVFRGDNNPAFVLGARSNDSAHQGRGPQSLHTFDVYTVGGSFPVGWLVPASDQQRCLRWNFNTPNAINVYVVPAGPRDDQGNTYNGWSPWGGYEGYVPDVGPSVYCDSVCINTDYLTAHEIMHPLMHVSHANNPRNDGGTATTELMEPNVSNDTAPDVTSRISDAPIPAAYQLPVGAGVNFVPFDGITALPNPPTNGQPTTPVLRLIAVGTSYGMIRTGVNPELDPAVTDFPAARRTGSGAGSGSRTGGSARVGSGGGA
jgi:hypothetical protein